MPVYTRSNRPTPSTLGRVVHVTRRRNRRRGSGSPASRRATSISAEPLKSSPVTRAPSRASESVSVPMWHCRCTTSRPAIVTESGQVERHHVAQVIRVVDVPAQPVLLARRVGGHPGLPVRVVDRPVVAVRHTGIVTHAQPRGTSEPAARPRLHRASMLATMRTRPSRARRESIDPDPFEIIGDVRRPERRCRRRVGRKVPN